MFRPPSWLLTTLFFLAACGPGGPGAGEGPDLEAGLTVDERVAYYDSLGEEGSAENLAILARALEGDHPQVRLTAIEAVGRIRSPEGVPLLEQASRDEVTVVRMTAARAAGHIDCTEAVELLSRLTRDDSIKVRRAAANALARLHRPESVPLLIEIARTESDKTMRHAAVQALGHVGPPAAEAIPLLAEMAAVEEEDIRWDAMDSIHKIGGEGAVASLQEQIHSDMPEIRGGAALALARSRAPGALDMILEALAVESIDVAAAAMARGAALLGEREASLPVLQRIVRVGDPWAARAEAAVALGESGDPTSIPYLEEARRDPHSEVRRRAADAIDLIRSRQAAS